MKLIVGTDFSAQAEKAAYCAALLARKWNDSIVLIHAFPSSVADLYPSSTREAVRLAEMNSLGDAVKRLSQTGVLVEGIALEGPAAKTLRKAASQPDTRLIVLGAHGSGEADRLGSVAARVAEHSSVPVLLVRSEEPFREWDDAKRPLRLFAAFDFTTASESALGWISQFTYNGPCEIVTGFVDWPVEEALRLGLPVSWVCQKNPPELQSLLERDLKARVHQVLGDADIKLRLEPAGGRPELKIIEMALQEQADILVTGTQQRHGIKRLWHPSASSFLLQNAPLNVLTVPTGLTATVPRRCASIHKILVAVDPTSPNVALVPYAYGLLNRGDAVRMLCVREPGYAPRINVPRDDVRRKDNILDLELEQQMSNLVPPDAQERGVSTEFSVVHSYDVATAVSQEAERFGASIICLGAHRHFPFSGRAMGSTAREIAQRSSRPILIVKSDA